MKQKKSSENFSKVNNEGENKNIAPTMGWQTLS